MDPLVTREVLLDLDMFAADGCSSLDAAQRHGRHLWLAVMLVQK